MSSKQIAISVRGLSKAYRIAQEKESTLAETLLKRARHPFRRRASKTFWALKDVSFNVAKGEIIGVIGRNGAGKSTLLKILSRITEPTVGQIKLYGRIGSLLEVGTGFHPELTGRENIYLNGAILGMAKAEIRKQFDEIVAFSGVEEFLDTPVKRYSSGMYVRLAFAVAAHLEPEILIVDEVLAVGDAEFQKKCMGKMQNVARTGRTILFVSHNMAAISNLCTRGIYMESGQLVCCDEVDKIAKLYTAAINTSGYQNLLDNPARLGVGSVRFLKIWIEDEKGNARHRVFSGENVVIAAEYKSKDNQPLRNVRASFQIADSIGQNLFVASTELTSPGAHSAPPEGVIRCVFPRLPLTGNEYPICAYLEVDGTTQDLVERAGTLRVEDGDFYASGKLYPPGWGGKGVLVDHHWIWPEFES